ncbi:MAG: hypothetical protein AVDCRST_MAG68-5040 [uncultured Gemmatimonadetes bacterium]|uniref:Uncharacterized protein n=1 Tax=uncultured Gemmatimonadota bacterium TaxID=203437 RepID=A0A6J4MNJ5_9BACT|nr:MAG: hypothetical protein AVDCRST_MAG68-5040 [uncultured Gemmatimonadota bacterium]
MGDVTPIGNREARRHWNRYVAEAREVYSEIELSPAVEADHEGAGHPADVIRVYVPTVERLNDLNQAEETGDVWKQLEVLLGDDTDRFRAVAADAPITALVKLMGDIIGDLGLSASPGNVPASSA